MSYSQDEQVSEKMPTDADETSVEVVLDNLSQSQRRSNWMILVGAPDWVRMIIHLMHIAQITEVRDWSKLTPTRNLDEVISLMQRPRVDQ